MSKIICDVCGTSYPDTSVQCPICGFVHSGENQVVADTAEKDASNGYTFVKGGRFSKSNVKKRNRGAKAPAPQVKKNDDDNKKTAKPKKQSNPNTGLIITIVVLLLAIVAVIAYIYVKFFMPTPDDTKNPDFSNDPVSGQVSQENEAPEADDIADTVVSCEEILLDTELVEFSESGQTATLHINILPADSTDTPRFSSADDSIAVIDQSGVITAVAEGETQITVTCGSVVANCSVVCKFETAQLIENFRLNRQEITFDQAGASWVIYNGEIPAADIVWSTDDAAVATVSNGKVTAVGEGSTTVYAEYQTVKLSCKIVCSFNEDDNSGHAGNGGVVEESDQSGTPNASEDNGQSSVNGDSGSGTYRLDNLYSSFDTEVTLSVGESFPLRLVDENGNYMNADWSVQDGSICSVDNGDVTALASGETYIIATYYGKQYRCAIHVI